MSSVIRADTRALPPAEMLPVLVTPASTFSPMLMIRTEPPTATRPPAIVPVRPLTVRNSFARSPTLPPAMIAPLTETTVPSGTALELNVLEALFACALPLAAIFDFVPEPPSVTPLMRSFVFASLELLPLLEVSLRIDW